MSLNQVKTIIRENRNDLAFILGNGINRYTGSNNLSWAELLKKLWSRITNQNQNIPHGISLTEYYDVIELRDDRNDSRYKIQKQVCDLLRPWDPQPHHQNIIESIEKLNCPILTTNFDEVLKKALDLNFFKLENPQLGFTDFYPWESYHSNIQLNSPTEGFGVWYINGMIEYYRSIRLGLSHYMGSVQKARKMIHHNDSELFHGKNQRGWIGRNTWLHILFNKSIIILGLGLNTQETFLRWLLLQRARYFKNFPHYRKKGWYIYKENEEDLERHGKNFFWSKLVLNQLV